MEDWTRGHVMLAVGAVVNSALYLTAVFFAGLWWSLPAPALMSAAAMGLAFLGYALRLQVGPATWVSWISMLSWVAGGLAGVMLVAGVFR